MVRIESQCLQCGEALHNYRGVAMFTFAMVTGSHGGVQNLLGLWELGLQDGCHYHGKSKQCNPSIVVPYRLMIGHFPPYFFG